MNASVMDDVDRRLLDIIQTNFPLSPRPYAELGQQTGISEEEALRRVNALRAARIIRAWERIFSQQNWAGFRPCARPGFPKIEWTPLRRWSTPAPA